MVAALRLLIKGEGYEAETAASPTEVLGLLKSSRFDLVLMDLNYARDTTSGQEGLGLLKSIRVIDSTLPVVVLTGWATLDLAVESMRQGVCEFVQKPWDNSRLLNLVHAQLARGRLLREGRRLHLEMDHQLAEAKEIQRGFVPRQLPPIPGCRIAVTWIPSGVLSGDYFDVLRFDERHFGLCIADAIGKGVPAALLMSNIQALVKGFASRTLSPRELCETLNPCICRTTAPNTFITFFYALLDAESRTLRYANAGHHPPILLRRDGNCVRLSEGGAVLGVCSDWRYTEGEVELNSGDRLLFFTDGVSEAMDADGEEFGERRLIEVMACRPGLDPQQLQSIIMHSVTEFCGGGLQDDATLISLSIDGSLP